MDWIRDVLVDTAPEECNADVVSWPAWVSPPWCRPGCGGTPRTGWRGWGLSGSRTGSTGSCRTRPPAPGPGSPPCPFSGMGATVSSGFGLAHVILDITTLWNNAIIISQAYIYLETSCVDIMVHKSHKMNAASNKTVSLLRWNNKTNYSTWESRLL